MRSTNGKTRVHSGIHVVPKRGKAGIRWYCYAWRGGPCIHKQDGPRPVIGPEMMALAVEARQGIEITSDRFDTVIDDYRASPEFERLADSTKRDYRLWLDRASGRFGKAPLAAFTDPRMRGEIIDWRNQWAHKPRTADKASVMLATVLAWAVENGRLAVNVAAGIKQLNKASRAEMIWEDCHWQAVEAEKDFPAHVMLALRLASLTGLRLGDLVRLDWGQVGPRAIIIEKTRKRGGRAVIPILPELRTLLDGIEKKTGPVLVNSRGTAWTESGLETVWQRRKPEGFNLRIHDLRGTFATRLIMAGFTDDQAALVMGWTAKRVAGIRARYVDEERVIIDLAEKMKA